MKYIFTIAAATLLLSACQQSGNTNASTDKGDKTAALPDDANICDRYFAFVQGYANKQDAAVKNALLKRLDYDKQSLPSRDKREADEYCKISLERMERMAG